MSWGWLLKFVTPPVLGDELSAPLASWFEVEPALGCLCPRPGGPKLPNAEESEEEEGGLCTAVEGELRTEVSAAEECGMSVGCMSEIVVRVVV